MTRVLELRDDEKRERIKFNWMHDVMYKDGLGCITLRFHDHLKPLLLNLKERFSMIPLKTVFKLLGLCWVWSVKKWFRSAKRSSSKS
jgi:plasmid replication initiation protein